MHFKSRSKPNNTLNVPMKWNVTILNKRIKNHGPPTVLKYIPLP